MQKAIICNVELQDGPSLESVTECKPQQREGDQWAIGLKDLVTAGSKLASTHDRMALGQGESTRLRPWWLNTTRSTPRYEGETFIHSVDANFIVWENFNPTMRQVACLRKAQTWKSMLVDEKHPDKAWGPLVGVIYSFISLEFS
ncbi:hypothetical protein cypCar_00025546 [Cyprinus carpio]|nr:hypothetical protein cypCar_00025546 [Cyprinus carpio]